MAHPTCRHFLRISILNLMDEDNPIDEISDAMRRLGVLVREGPGTEIASGAPSRQAARSLFTIP